MQTREEFLNVRRRYYTALPKKVCTVCSNKTVAPYSKTSRCRKCYLQEHKYWYPPSKAIDAIRGYQKGKTGKLHPAWKHGNSPINKIIRRSKAFFDWRKLVFQRDDYRCFNCGERGGELHPHHIYSFSQYPRLRFMIENGITLCAICHRKTSTWGARTHPMNCG